MAKSNDHQDRNYKLLAGGVVLAGLLLAAIYGLTVADGHPVRVAMATLLIAGAPFAVGGLAGFLFGIPKTVQADGSANDPNAPRHRWQTNTNLEQVSDWVTKIMIGVGLTQLEKIPGQLQDTAEYIASALGKNASAPIVAAMLVTFAISGFVIAYLLTKFDLGFAIDAQDGLLDQLAGAIVKNPNDRTAVESYMLSSLYLEPPESFDRAIRAGESFLIQEGHPHAEDANVFAYLACGYGQRYAYLKRNNASANDLAKAKDKVVSNVQSAIDRDPSWRPKFRQLANPPVGSKDDDLVALKDEPELLTKLADPPA